MNECAHRCHDLSHILHKSLNGNGGMNDGIDRRSEAVKDAKQFVALFVRNWHNIGRPSRPLLQKKRSLQSLPAYTLLLALLVVLNNGVELAHLAWQCSRANSP